MDSNSKTIKCPRCLNYMVVHKKMNGCFQGSCSKCKSVISAKKTSSKETTIKILTL